MVETCRREDGIRKFMLKILYKNLNSIGSGRGHGRIIRGREITYHGITFLLPVLQVSASSLLANEGVITFKALVSDTQRSYWECIQMVEKFDTFLFILFVLTCGSRMAFR